MNLELFLRTQEEIFEFRKLYGDEKMSVVLGESEVMFVSETGKTHELGTSKSCLHLISYGLVVPKLGTVCLLEYFNFKYGIRV